jgi:lipoprotein-anchoring transpeptidase ErfK/SrfK
MRAVVQGAVLAVILAWGMVLGTATGMAVAAPAASGVISEAAKALTASERNVQQVDLFGGLFRTRRTVDFDSRYRKGDIVVKTGEFRLYYVIEKGKAYRYRIGVGREGYAWSGTSHVSRKAIDNPLGARALYLGSSLYRIHGTRYKRTLGRAISSGCIRMLNDDIVELYNMVRVGARVYVLP